MMGLLEGDGVGINVGSAVGFSVGIIFSVGVGVGAIVGENEGDTVGVPVVGDNVESVGVCVGDVVGLAVWKMSEMIWIFESVAFPKLNWAGFDSACLLLMNQTEAFVPRISGSVCVRGSIRTKSRRPPPLI